jgi:preprotein translocase subunit SecA
VLAAGGLCVLGSERHATRRLDEQLRGRAGRQGDPGESQFYLSLRDDLLRSIMPGMVDALMQRLHVPDDQPLQSTTVNNQIRTTQAGLEARNAHSRHMGVRYDQVVDRQRAVIYGERLRVLTEEDQGGRIEAMIDDVVHGLIRAAMKPAERRDGDLVALMHELTTLYPVAAELRDLPDRPPAVRPDERTLVALFTADARQAYQRNEIEIGSGVLRQIERQVLLEAIDRLWGEHLDEMDVVRDSVSLSFLSGVDPLVEYQRRGHDRFRELLDRIKHETVGLLFNMTVTFEGSEEDEPSAQHQ